MAESYTCFLLEPTDNFRQSLRRFTWSKTGFDCAGGYHNAHARIPEIATVKFEKYMGWGRDDWPHDDARWPAKCEKCDYVFQPSDPWQQRGERIFRRVDTGEEMTVEEAPIGAMWFMEGEYAFRTGPDGKALYVKIPGDREWCPDCRASNCDRKQDKEHYCWCRHGEVPRITVDKTPEAGHFTCGAGAGSIQTGTWHGFLKDGVLVPC